MKVKIKGKDNLHDVVAWSSQTVEEADKGLFTGTKTLVVPVVIIVLRGTTNVEVHSVQDIEELHR
jgi:hypothetical protein